MAAPRPGVGERAAGDGHELPAIAGGREGQFQDPGCAARARLAVGLDRVEAVEPDPAGADGELADAARLIYDAGGRLWREALVQLVVRVEHELRARRVQVVPQRLDRVAHGGPRRAEARHMPDRGRTLLAAGREVGLEPQLLGRARAGREL